MKTYKLKDISTNLSLLSTINDISNRIGSGEGGSGGGTANVDFGTVTIANPTFSNFKSGAHQYKKGIFINKTTLANFLAWYDENIGDAPNAEWPFFAIAKPSTVSGMAFFTYIQDFVGFVRTAYMADGRSQEIIDQIPATGSCFFLMGYAVDSEGNPVEFFSLPLWANFNYSMPFTANSEMGFGIKMDITNGFQNLEENGRLSTAYVSIDSSPNLYAILNDNRGTLYFNGNMGEAFDCQFFTAQSFENESKAAEFLTEFADAVVGWDNVSTSDTSDQYILSPRTIGNFCMKNDSTYQKFAVKIDGVVSYVDLTEDMITKSREVSDVATARFLQMFGFFDPATNGEYPATFNDVLLDVEERIYETVFNVIKDLVGSSIVHDITKEGDCLNVRQSQVIGYNTITKSFEKSEHYPQIYLGN